jgi:hypothetical protein
MTVSRDEPPYLLDLLEPLRRLQHLAFSHLLYDLSTLPELVRAMDGITEPARLAAVVADPNTPLDRLLALAPLYPAELCANPIFPFLLFENPNLPAELSAPAMGRLLAYEGLPRDFVAAAAAFAMPASALAARQHIAIAGEAGDDWRTLIAEEVGNLPTVPDDDLLLVLVLLGLVPEWMHGRLAATGDPRMLAALRGEAPQPVDVTPVSLPLPTPGSLAEQAAQPDAEQSLLQQLVDSEDVAVRRAIAANPATSPEVLQRLYDQEVMFDNEPLVFQALAANHHSPQSVLQAIAAHPTALNTIARRAVARNPAASGAVLALLVDEPYAADIRLALAVHPHFDHNLRSQMRSSSLEQALNCGDAFYRAIALSQPESETSALFEAAYSYNWLDRLAVALNSHTPAETLTLLTKDGHRLVRAAARRRFEAPK